MYLLNPVLILKWRYDICEDKRRALTCVRSTTRFYLQSSLVGENPPDLPFVPIRYQGGFDTIPRTRFRHKRSQMPCNLVNFILVNRESEVGRGWQRGEDTRKKERSKVEKTPAGEERSAGGRYRFDTTTDLTMPSHVRSAQSLCRRGGPGEGRVQQRGVEEESKRAPRSMCCPFMGAFVHAQSVSAYVQFVPHVLPA